MIGGASVGALALGVGLYFGLSHSSAPKGPVMQPAAYFSVQMYKLPANLGVPYDLRPSPPDASTEAASLNLPAPLLPVYTANDFRMRENWFLFRPGFDPNAEDAWPSGQSGVFQISLNFFSSNNQALAVEKASEGNLVSHNFTLFHPRGLDVMAAFFSNPTGNSHLRTIIVYGVERNTYIGVALSGNDLKPSVVPEDEAAIYHKAEGLLISTNVQPIPTLTKAQAGQEYLSLASNVNRAQTTFYNQAQTWTGSTTNQTATAAGTPFITTLRQAIAGLGSLEMKFPPASSVFATDALAATQLMNDVKSLSQLSTLGVNAWAMQYDGDRDKLITASNAVRLSLGLSSTSP